MGIGVQSMKLEHDAKTGDLVVRELTDAEEKRRELDVTKAAERIAERNLALSAAASARAKLKTLGLTDDEIAALVG